MDYPRFSTSLRSNIIDVFRFNHGDTGSGTDGISKPQTISEVPVVSSYTGYAGLRSDILQFMAHI